MTLTLSKRTILTLIERAEELAKSHGASELGNDLYVLGIELAKCAVFTDDELARLLALETYMARQEDKGDAVQYERALLESHKRIARATAWTDEAQVEFDELVGIELDGLSRLGISDDRPGGNVIEFPGSGS